MGYGSLRELAATRVLRRREPVVGLPVPSAGEGRVPVLKADDEMRFTLAPLYAPGVMDAHDEYVGDARQLQEAVHEYVRAGDLRLRLMHKDEGPGEEVTVGHLVEVFTLPWNVEVPMVLPDGTSKSVRLPEGTVLAGVVWDERAWPAVKDGRLGGLSLGGLAERQDGDATVPAVDALEGDFVALGADNHATKREGATAPGGAAVTVLATVRG